MPESARTKVLISYSHRDERYVDRLEVHLAFYKRHGQLDVWKDRNLLPGALWQKEMNRVLLSARVAILLVSANFLASEFIARFELPSLLAAAESDGAAILPVILSPCVFSDSELSQFQTVNDLARPLTRLSLHEKEEVWVKVAKTVADIMHPLQY